MKILFYIKIKITVINIYYLFSNVYYIQVHETMNQANKRTKVTNDSHIEDIATSIGELSSTIKSIGETHATLLKINKAVVVYLQSKKANSLNLDNTIENRES
ncbi:hypothetical protein PV327_004426 [Microctonus hyperodae]|uniref:Uncharacterized protein n=2 Tax=Microctonus hyperodae TaxID=165561 RepID=A0AA39FCE1_MICHY|nr:hypothetical protein PV327_004426 [Microctonus hyperodae]